MNFTNLKYFSVLAEELNFTKAAKRLYISQQALSSHINKLEQHFQSQLFIRSTPLELTSAGQCLYLFAKETLLYEKMTTEKIHQLNQKERPRLTIATTLSRGNLLLPLVLPPFRRLFPDVRVELIQSTSTFVEQLLLDKKADVLICSTPAPKDSIISEFLCMENLSLFFTETCIREACPKDWQERISLLDSHFDLKLVENLPFIKMLDSLPLSKSFKNICQTYQAFPQVYLEVRAIETQVSLCLAGLGAMICPDMFVTMPKESDSPTHKLYKFPVHTGTPIPSISISYLNQQPVAPYILTFSKLVRESLKDRMS
ncbi:MAG: LysR family transcriptional regulator [Lachnospiraceae bacterium]|nr:LysR family transcriptional regulator [Lachnospiraceae bacterium]